MTTPAPGLVTGSFGGTLTPAQVWALLNALVEGSPFAASLTRAETATGRMSFPTVGPTGFAWLEELQAVPSLLLNDKALIVAVAKVAGLLPVSSEMQSDAAVNITSWVQGALADSLSRDLDLGLLRGTGSPQPDGIIAQADPVEGPTLIAAAGAAIAAIGEAGGTDQHDRGEPHRLRCRADRHRRGRAAGPPGRADRPDRAGHRAGSGPGPARWSTTRAGASWCWARTATSPCTTTRTMTPCCCWSRPGPTSGCRSRTRRSASWTSPSPGGRHGQRPRPGDLLPTLGVLGSTPRTRPRLVASPSTRPRP